MQTAKIMIVDDHPVVRHGIRTVIEAEQGLEVIAEAGESKEALEKVQKYRPDILILDLKIPGLGGVKVIPEVKKISPSTEIIVFTMYDDPGYVYETIINGASGYLLKDTPLKELVRAIKVIKEGKGYLQAEVTKSVLNKLAFDAKMERDKLLLSEREIKILQLMAEGNINKEIASNLQISEETVKTHLKKIFEKLGASARSQAVAIAFRKNLLG